MSFAGFYFKKFNSLPPYITQSPPDDLNIVVTIPCINEPNLIDSLKSLKNCSAPECSVEVIVVVNSAVNSPETVKRQNMQTIESANSWIAQNNSSCIRFHIVHAPDLPKKHAGAGLARKIAMDEALHRFNKADNPHGIIACFDADSFCDDNYLIELQKNITPEINGANIRFEHPVDGEKYDQRVYNAITDYELYLRYYKQALGYTGFPYSFHTVGSSMAVRAEIYAKQGGMNKKKAGEDFYFLHKIFPLGNFIEINTTRIIPSPRPSDRVPFGTGAAITKAVSEPEKTYTTYHIEAFEILKHFFGKVQHFYSAENTEIQYGKGKILHEFLLQNNFEDALQEMKKHSTALPTFRKRFFEWFNAFRILKFLNYSHETHFVKQPLNHVANQLLMRKNKINSAISSNKDLLKVYRAIDFTT